MPRSTREVAVGLEARDVVRGVARVEEMLAPQVLREAGEGEAVAGDLGLEPVAIVPGRVVLRVRVAVEAAELEPVELQLGSCRSTVANGIGFSP